MSEIVPKGRADKLQFFRAHRDLWVERAAELGLSPGEVAELEEKLDAALAARQRQAEAQSAARSATLLFNHALDALAGVGSTLLKRIKATAAAGPADGGSTDGGSADGGSADGGSAGDNHVYALAGIAPPARPSPVAPPGTPSGFDAALIGATGAIKLTWRCRNPRSSTGTLYHVSRQVDGAGPLEFLGVSGKKMFIDRTLPRGAGRVVYKVRGIRSTALGPLAAHLVQLCGSANGGPADGRSAEGKSANNESAEATFLPARRRRGVTTVAA